MTLFDLPPIETPQPTGLLSPDRRRTINNNTRLASGVHPATGRKLLDTEWGSSCAGCANAVHVYTGGSRAYWKCRRHRLGMSMSAASDIRISWPACELYVYDPIRSRP